MLFDSVQIPIWILGLVIICLFLGGIWLWRLHTSLLDSRVSYHHLEEKHREEVRQKKITSESLKAALDEQKAHQEALDERNKELIENNRVRAQMFSIISHDMRSPINSILGLLSLLGEGNLNLEESKTYAKKARVRVQNTLEMLTNLLHWSQNRINGVKLNPSKVDLQRLLARQLPVYKEIARQKKVVLQNEIYDPLKLYCDKEMLTIITRNFISNAIKFTKPGGKITLSAVPMEDQVCISVRDTGIGMDTKTKAKLFSSRLESKRGTKDEKGTGLGLKLCKNFVEMHDGKVIVDSQEGKGSTFRFVLPKYTEKVSIPRRAQAMEQDFAGELPEKTNREREHAS